MNAIDSIRLRRLVSLGVLALGLQILVVPAASFAGPPGAVPGLLLEQPGSRAHDAPMGGSDRYLFSLKAQYDDSLPPPALAAAIRETEEDVPALVPVAPPVWAGVALLGMLAMVRSRQRRRRGFAGRGG